MFVAIQLIIALMAQSDTSNFSR